MGYKYTDTKKRITNKEIIPEEILNSVKNDQVGATDFFIGTVRNFSEAGKIEGMIYESYTTMAEESLKQIENEASQKWDVKKIMIIHRIGNLSVGDISLAVAVSTPHRDDAFKLVDTLLKESNMEFLFGRRKRLQVGKKDGLKEDQLRNNIYKDIVIESCDSIISKN